MMDVVAQPPESDGVNASTLARIFDDVTNSYKFLFFLALLDNAERNHFDARVPISLNEIVLDMLVQAWYPHVYFKLSFGKSDRIARELDKAVPLNLVRKSSIKPWDKRAIRELIAGTANTTDLTRFVPYRLIRPFFPETRGMKKDHEVNMRVAEMCEEYFPSGRPPYKFDKTHSHILLHTVWAAYMKQNLAVLRGWAWWNFLQYMQRCNPNVPAISAKLFPPPERMSLESQSKFWNVVLAAKEFRCIYSGGIIRSDDFALDHFVPWSFVVHNQPWNLIPTSKSVNSKKSDHLPSLTYFDAFISEQHDALTRSRDLLKQKVWEEYASCFVADLGLPNYDAILDKAQLDKAYRASICPLLQLAELNGFAPSWTY
jgi:5-methylcytosine-specific restriction endonuclease McrA